MHRPLLRTVATMAALLALPSAAHAAQVSLDSDGTLVYKATSASEGLSVVLSSQDDYDTGQTYLRFGDGGADSRQIAAGAPCFLSEGYDPQILCERNPTRPIRIEGSNAVDSISVFSADDVPDSIPITILGHGGNDQLQDAYDSATGRVLDGGAGNDTIDGYGGDDVLQGGDGDDKLDGGEGNDHVLGGAGNDELLGDRFKAPGADVIDGGPGNDLAGEWSMPGESYNPKPTISLDGVANDGRPGEGDNVVDVERIEQFLESDLIGSDGPESLEIKNGEASPVTLAGNGGDDKLLAWDGNDSVNGGAGNDHVEGGLGSDVVVGGPGQDTIYGEGTRSFCGGYSCKIPFGNDTIDAADGEKDTVDCGAGDDTAKVDAIDSVANCERVEVVGPAAGGGAGGGGGAGAGAAGPKVTVTGLTVKALRGGKAKVKVPCAGACRVEVALKAKGRTVATGRATLLKAGTATVVLKPAKKAKASLKRAKSLKGSLVVKVRDAAGTTRTTTRSVSLKRG